MLRTQDNIGRSYEERIIDALSSLPLISSEWTNHNPSDPGITILENLVAFETLQGSLIEEMGNAARLALLKLAGFTPKKGKCARLLLSANDTKGSITLNAGHRFSLGNLVYETKRVEKTGAHHLTGIFSEYGGKIHDYCFLADHEVNVPVRVFGDQPKAGDRICFISDSLPDPGEETCFYISIDARFNRNPVENRGQNIFAALKWECFTENGFEEIHVRDYTGAFLLSGEIKLRMPDTKAAVYKGKLPVEGYCIRATLSYAHYDIRPRFTAVDAFLFEVWQKDSKSVCQTFQNTNKITVQNPFSEEGYILCFAKERKGYSYRRYELQVTKGQKGRYCRYIREEDGRFSLEFDKEAYGYEPARVKDAVRVVIYSEAVMRRYNVGQVLGYDDQEINLPFRAIVPDTFCLIAKKKDAEGGELFDFVRPHRTGEGDLYYDLLEKEGKIVIRDAGNYIGAELFMGGVAVTEGPRGNIRAGGRLSSHRFPGVAFYNPGPGTGGAFRESLEEVRMRFREDLYTPYTCVTAEDYERVVQKTPGLCIKKVHAVMHELENSVHITVMPGTDEDFPSLSQEYLAAIEETLLERRLISTRYHIVPPVYTAVSAHAIVYVKRRFVNSRAQIEEVIRTALDYSESEKNFGEVLKYEDVFAQIEDLDCVDYIYELFLGPKDYKYARLKGSDIHPADNCLLYPGDIDIEVIASER
ncbi:MAG: baseplate J/gp47 family protein [Lachnospiraceae bacterium]|nr:baseplate J/gp47 family protein [Lachnospiraceae bacterium]